jgi:hypothetical protein
VVGVAPCRRSQRQHSAIWPPAQQRDGVPRVFACRSLWRRLAGLDLCRHILLQRVDMPHWLHTFDSAPRLQRLTMPDRQDNSMVGSPVNATSNNTRGDAAFGMADHIVWTCWGRHHNGRLGRHAL